MRAVSTKEKIKTKHLQRLGSKNDNYKYSNAYAVVMHNVELFRV